MRISIVPRYQAYVELTRGQLELLNECSRAHYDDHCRSASKVPEQAVPGGGQAVERPDVGFLNAALRWNFAMGELFGTNPEHTSSVLFSLDQLDTMLKILEVASMLYRNDDPKLVTAGRLVVGFRSIFRYVQNDYAIKQHVYEL